MRFAGFIPFCFGFLWGCFPAAEERYFEPSQVWVVDGDTVRIADDTYRLLGLDTPETYRSQCAEELALGEQATRRLRKLLDDSETIFMAVEDRPDKYGRILAKLIIDDVDVASVLIGEGLARPYQGGQRQSWCG